MHDSPPQHDQPNPEYDQPQFPPGFQHGHGSIPSYPEFYQEFQQLRIRQEQMDVRQQTYQQEVYAGFMYVFYGFRQVFPQYTAEPTTFPFPSPYGGHDGGSTFGGAGPSGTRHDDDDTADQ